jgi:hypothetical protein
MPFAHTANPTPAALAKRLRRLAHSVGWPVHRTRSGWVIETTAGPMCGLSTEAALQKLQQRLAAIKAWDATLKRGDS